MKRIKQTQRFIFFKMKHWELTTACVPHLKAVLCAVERTQLDFYGVDRNFLEIEEVLTAFLETIKQVKKQHDDILHQLQRCQSDHQQSDVD